MQAAINQKELKKILSDSGVIFGYLFGSRAEDRAIESSDYDFAFFLKEKSPIKRFKIRLLLSEKLARILKKNVDVVILNDTRSLTLAYSIVSKGELIIDEQIDFRQNYELRIMCEYEDFLPMLNDFNKAYLERST